MNNNESIATESTQLLSGNRPKVPTPTIECNNITIDCVIARIYLNPCLLHQEQVTRVPKELELPQKVKEIRDRVRRLKDNTDSGNELFDTFHGGDISLCGSIAEGTKVGSADEFDFQYLLTVDELEPMKKRLIRTKPRSANHESRSFFSLWINHENGTRDEIVASTIHDKFLNRIKFLLQDIEGDFELKKAGPAVKISYQDEEGHTIKIDLTLGLRTKNRDIEHLTPLAKRLHDEGRFKCHFVAAHDYWKICFVETEQDLLQEIIEADEIKGAVYRIIKLLRDEADIKDPYGDGILPSYPIKVTFLDMAYKDFERLVEWSNQDVTFHVMKILREEEKRGQSHTLCSLFLEGDDIMSEADRSYLESRRLLKELKAKEKFYVSLRHKLVCYMTSLILSIVLMLVLKRLLLTVEQSPDRAFGYLQTFFTLYCLYILKLTLLNSEQIFKIYRLYPLSCLLILVFNHLPMFIADQQDPEHQTPVHNTLWRFYDISSGAIGIMMVVILLYHSCKGLYTGKAFFIADASAFYFNIWFPFRWKSPSGRIKQYLPEIGNFTRKLRTIYIISILLSGLTLVSLLLIVSLLLCLNMHWLSESSRVIISVIGEKDSVRTICFMLTPLVLGAIDCVILLVSNCFQRRALKQHAVELLSDDGPLISAA